MKKVILSLFAITSLLVAESKTITPEEALDRVVNDRRTQKLLRSPQSVKQMTLKRTINAKDGSGPTVYIFENGRESRVLIAADDLATPLLGYTDNAAAGELPPQLERWIEAYNGEITAARAAEKKGAGSFNENLLPYNRPYRNPIKPLVDTKWNQDKPYNNMCPKKGTRATYTGCGATAMAQIMKYYNYPEKGTGTGIATVAGSTEVTMDLGVTFEWDKMLSTYSGTYTEEEANAVATLMAACGYSIKMDYNTSASGAFGRDIPPALINNFHYANSARFLYRMYYGIAEWEGMIYENLSKYGPLYYDGYVADDSGAHAFVCDGYSSDGYFHFNWGWGGYYDGHFLLTALNPGGQGIGGYEGGYNDYQAVVLGIHKPDGTDYTPEPRLSLYLYATKFKPEITNKTTLTLKTSDGWGGYFNLTGRTISCYVAIRFTNTKDPSDVLYCENSGYETIEPEYGFNKLTADLSTIKLNSGSTYRVDVVTRKDKNSEWLEANLPVYEPSTAYVTNSYGSYSLEELVYPEPSLTEIGLTSPIYYKKPCEISFTVVNNTKGEILNHLTPVLLTLFSDGSPSVKGSTEETLTIDLEPGQSETYRMAFTFSNFTSYFKLGGEYYIGLKDYLTGEIVGYSKEVYTVDEAPAAGTLSADGFEARDYTLYDDYPYITFDANVSLDSGFDPQTLYVLICDRPSSGNIIATGSSDILFLEGGRNYRVAINVEKSLLETGTNYFAILCKLKSNKYTSLAGTLTIKLSAESDVKATTDEDDNTPGIYYTLQGIRVEKPVKGNFYIVCKGNKTTKIKY